MIRDLEEQLLRIPRPEAREQMAEAVRCYHAGAHRAAIVMAFAAAMDDLRRKLVDLAGSGGASSDLKAAVGHIESTFALQRAFEEDAIATAQVHAQLISPDEAKALQSYLKLRHLCAHPSGYVATAEEARAVIARVTDSVLSRPATLGMVFVDQLLQRLRSEHFFPAQDVESVTKTLGHELSVMSPGLLPALILKLADAMRTENEAAPPNQRLRFLRAPLYRNALAALSGLATLPQAEAMFWRQRAVQELVLSPDDPLTALSLLAARPAAITTLDDITRGRLLLVANRHLHDADVRQLLKALEPFLRPGERNDLAQSLKRDFVDSLAPRSPIMLAEVGWPDLEDALVERVLAQARATSYIEVNIAIGAADALTAGQVSRISAERRTEFLLDIALKTEGTYPSFVARDRRKDGLGARTDFIDAVIETARGDVRLFVDKEAGLHAHFEMLLASQRPDAVAAIIGALTTASRVLPERAREAAAQSTFPEIVAAVEDALPV